MSADEVEVSHLSRSNLTPDATENSRAPTVVAEGSSSEHCTVPRASAEHRMCPGGRLRPIKDAPALLEEARDMEVRIAELEDRLAEAHRRLRVYEDGSGAGRAGAGLTEYESGLGPPELNISSEPPDDRHQTTSTRSSHLRWNEAEEAQALVGLIPAAQPDTLVGEDGQLTLGDEPGTSFFFGSAGAHYLWVSTAHAALELSCSMLPSNRLSHQQLR